ncbi:12840_t:CDS:1 [Cetraspora pellucida]|uniref:12840_t:CDS:1 n=1 Tax=Cetraspora pellucida TaxID=1433469 RepID=A0A9N8ZYA4_9GLOM|nr:12840_t:CDS:1 [Cetraspora pellucida]
MQYKLNQLIILSLQKNQTQSTPVPMQVLPQIAQITSSQSKNTVTSVTTYSLNLSLLDFLPFSDYTKQSQKRLSKDTTKNKLSSKKSKHNKEKDNKKDSNIIKKTYYRIKI